MNSGRSLRLMAFVILAASTVFTAGFQACAAQLPPIRHVFLIVLENKNFAQTFGPDSSAPYLAKTLPSKGALLTQYYGIGHASLQNYLALISGQPPNPRTQADCSHFTEFRKTAQNDANGIAVGSGCLYPLDVKTIAAQLDAAHLTWRGYMEDLGDDPAREASNCAQPPLGGDGAPSATAVDMYAYRHDPFIYFRSITDRETYCTAHVVNLHKLFRDLSSIATTPNYAFIVPNVCNDGHDSPCADGRPGGLVSIDPWLRIVVPRILASPAFRQDGLLIITFDEAADDSTACCGEPAGPNIDKPGYNGPGGGRIGAVMLSPFIKPGTVSTTPINHYGLLRGVEDIFGLPHLGYAARPANFPAIFVSARDTKQ